MAEMKCQHNLATKADLQELRGDLLTEIRASETRIVKWGAGMMAGMALGMITAMAALLRLFL